jgi:hypothetical protein
VSQGSGLRGIWIRDNRFYGGPGNAKSRCVMIDDGGEGRFYNAITGEPGTGPANGWVILERNLIVGDGTENWGTIVRIGTLSPWVSPPIEVARGYALLENGIYTRLGALQTKVEISGVKNVLIHGNNTPEIRSVADALIPIGTEANVIGPHTAPASKDIRTGIFAKLGEPPQPL